MKPAIQFFTLIGVLLLSDGCASIVSKSKWPIVVGTTPNGATLSITNKKGKEVYKGTTPAALTLKSGAGFFAKESYLVKITMAGYDEKTVPLDCKLNGWYFGNILIGGLIGLLIVDPATGAMYKLDTDAIHEKMTVTSASITPSLKVLGIDQIPQSWRNHLVSIH